MHSNNNLLHTLIRNMGLIFSSSHDNDDHRRWLCGTEALISQAFPVHPEFRAANDVILTSFNTLRPRKPRIICGQAGNSMNINIAFIVELHSWLCWRRADNVSLYRHAFAMKLANSKENSENDVVEQVD